MLNLAFMNKDSIQSLGLALLRIGPAALMLTHGYSKLLKLLAGGEIQFYDFAGLGAEVSLALAVLGELVAPAAMILGFKTRWFAVPALITMLVAAFGAHWAEPRRSTLFSLRFPLPPRSCLGREASPSTAGCAAASSQKLVASCLLLATSYLLIDSAQTCASSMSVRTAYSMSASLTHS